MYNAKTRIQTTLQNVIQNMHDTPLPTLITLSASTTSRQGHRTLRKTTTARKGQSADIQGQAPEKKITQSDEDWAFLFYCFTLLFPDFYSVFSSRRSYNQ